MSYQSKRTYELISLNVVLLFTNILSNLALENVSNRWGQISKGANIPKNEILKTLTNIGVNLFQIQRNNL